MRTITLASFTLLALLCRAQEAASPDWDKETAALLEKAISDDPAVAIPAQDEIREVGRPCVPALRAALKDKKAAKRFFACELLGDIHDPAAVEDLAGLLEDLVEDRTGEPVAAAAARALGRLADSSVADKLIAALNSKDLNLQYEAARALGNLRVKKAEARLLEILKARETKETFRGGLLPAAACEALGKIRSLAALPEIMTMLESLTPETLRGWSYDQFAIMALERVAGESKGAWDDEKKKEETKKAWKEWFAKQPKTPEPPK
ncbi:MAG: HEAT repeat-containing PBS [Planctomycetota bacterium]|nr:MAG: HEAT repeat-containing PBS [Planctomycetota bacterium]